MKLLIFKITYDIIQSISQIDQYIFVSQFKKVRTVQNAIRHTPAMRLPVHGTGGGAGGSLRRS